MAVLKHLLHFNAFLKANTEANASLLQCSHQLATIVDLAILREKQPSLPTRADAWNFFCQFSLIKGLTQARRGIDISLL